MIKVLVVDDSPSARRLLTEILGSDKDIEVVGTASNGLEALEMLKKVSPDVITMDIYMPEMDGFEATGRILETAPIPIVIISSCYTPEEVEKTFESVAAGAVAILPKPRITDETYEQSAVEIVRTVKLMSEVRVVTRRPRIAKPERRDGRPNVAAATADIGRALNVIAIGASTGGPPVLQTVFSMLPPDFQVPIVVVQHITVGFLQGMIDWLSQTTGKLIKAAVSGELLVPGRIYFAPEGFHMGVDGGGRVTLCKEDPENGMRPSVSYLFRSIAKTMGGSAVGVLLTGMGKDGSNELKLIRDRGGLTIAQDEESSVVHGMPGEAIKAGGAIYVLPPDKIAALLTGLAASKT